MILNGITYILPTLNRFELRTIFAPMTELEAKCPNCTKRATVDEKLTKVNCRACGFTTSYEDYLEIMKSKAVQMADDLQMDWDKS
jgi:hypothetical protein